jgi:hypothetical protein
LTSAKPEHVAQLALAKDRHQRIDDRADAAAGERDDDELPPVRQLNRNDVTATDAHAAQGAGSALDRDRRARGR